MSQPGSESSRHSEAPHDDAINGGFEGYDLQVAIDQLAGGSTDALRLYLARQEGLDPSKVSLAFTPWHATEDSSIAFIGGVDDINPPGAASEDAVGRERPQHSQRIALKNTGIPYKYSELRPQLSQLRLLKLSAPGEDGIIRQLELRTFSLDDAPEFFCLSYVWGDPSQFLAVNCDGGMIPVTQNLFHALRTCFGRYPEYWLWADGICINQQDLAERSSQVQLMGSIYEKASMVLAHPGNWVYGKNDRASGSDDEGADEDKGLGGLGAEAAGSSGEEKPEVSMTLDKSPDHGDSYGTADFHLLYTDDAYSSDNVQSALSIMTFLTRTWTVGSEGKVMSDTYWDKTDLPNPVTFGGQQKWANLMDFWCHEWYFRTWVLQEVVLAAKVVVLYQDAAVSLDAITEFWSLVGSRSLPRILRIGPLADVFNRVRHLSPISSIKSLRDRRGSKTESGTEFGPDTSDAVRAGPPSAPDLLELLCLSRSNLATDPRDKVYGLLGLTQDAISRSIVPDYSPENTVAKLFTDVATKLVCSDRARDLLHHAGMDRNVSHLPSWVPDWTKQSRSTLPVHLYQCMGTTTPNCTLVNTKEGKRPKLRARGVIISLITIVGAPWKFYSHGPSEPSFGRFKNAPDMEIAPEPPLNDEDAKNLIFNMTTSFEQDIGDRYGEEGFQDALARTLAADCSWQGHRIGRRNPEPTDAAATTTEERQSPMGAAESSAAPGVGFFAGLDAFKRFYARGPESEEDLEAPGIRVHQTGLYMWLLDFDEEVEADLQHRMVPFTAPFQEAQRGRRFAVLGKPSTGNVPSDGDSRATNDDGSDDGTGAGEEADNHFMGTVPWDAESGDYCVLLEGFRTPFILRKRLRRGRTKSSGAPSGADGSGLEEFKLVGDCYVHGVMDGELLRWADEVGEELGPEFRSVNEEAREYVVRAPQGYVPFTDFVLG